MLKSINTKYLMLGLLLTLGSAPFVDPLYFPIHIFNVLTVVVFYITINYNFFIPEKEFTSRRLGLMVFFYAAIFVSVFKIISYYYRGNFFVFSEMDAVTYDYESRIMAGMNFSDAITYFLQFMSFDDLGAVLVISSLYRIVESNLFVNFFYIITGVFTALCIFRISKTFMSAKYSYLCALTYSISSFTLWCHSSGQKESFMIMLVVLFFDQFYQFYKYRKLKSIIFCVIPLLSLLLFRPIIIFFCIGSVGLGLLLSRKVNAFSLALLVLIFVAVIYSSTFFSDQSNRFMYDDTEQLIEAKDKAGMIKGGLAFTYVANIVSATIGPMPTMLPNEKTMLSLFSPGLIYRVLMGAVLWFGIFYIIKTKETSIYPLVLFYFLEAASLVYIMEALELRKSLPHFPMIYIISFWFLEKYSRSIFISNRKKLRIRTMVGFSSILFLFLIIYWNNR